MEYIREYLNLCEDNWWFVTRNDLVIYFIEKYKNKNKEIKIVDIGCGPGNMLLYLKRYGFKNLYGVENNMEFIKKLESYKDIVIDKNDAGNTSFDSNLFDVAILSDVLEHIEDENEVIREIHRILKNDGIVILFVPAFMFMWSYHDLINGHKRRYTKREILERFKNGFKILKISYWNFFLFLPVVFIRLFKKVFKIKESDFYKLNKINNAILKNILFFENFLLRYVNLPFGVSLFLVAKKEGL